MVIKSLRCVSMLLRRTHVRFLSSSRILHSPNYITDTSRNNAIRSLSEITQSDIPTSVYQRLPLPSESIEAFIQLQSQNPSFIFPLDLIINSAIYASRTSSTALSSKQLGFIASTITNHQDRIDMRTLLNYGTLISLLPSSLYESLSVYDRYRLFHQPFIATCSLESFSMRVDKLMAFLTEMDSVSVSKDDYESLKKAIRPDLVETITHSLNVGSEEYALAFLDYYDRQYPVAPLEDVHSWLYESLDGSSDEVVCRLLQNPRLVAHLPPREREMALLSVVRRGDTDTFLKVWERQNSVTSYSASLMIELLGDNDIDQCFELMNYIQPMLSEDLQISDFNFIIDLLKRELKLIGVERNKTYADLKSSKDYGASGDLKRPDIEYLIKHHKVFNEPYEQKVKSMFANLLLKAVSELTNTTGVVFLYTNIPLSSFDPLSYQIMFRCCERGNDGSLRAYELFRYACSRGIVVPEIGFTSLFKTSLVNTDELVFYLSHFFQSYDQFSICTWHRLNNMATFRWTPQSSKDLIVSLLGSSSPKSIIDSKLSELPQHFLTTFQPTDHKTHYDLRESAMLKRHHNSSN